MCLIAFAWRSHPDFPLVIAANRDEFFDRPALAARWWRHRRQELFAGRDLKAGGTWLGVGANGRFAALTNVRNPSAMLSDAPSRGGLVPDFIAGEAGVADALEALAGSSGRYNGFNLLLFDGANLGVYESPNARGRVLAPGVYALSNADLEAPWPKQRRASAGMTRALASLPATDALFRLLHDDRPAADAALPATGVPREWERALSSLFIRAPGYGTRYTTTLVFDRDGGVRFEERSWDAAGRLAGRAQTTLAAIRQEQA